ncbi:tetratricopeptide repeat protein [Actinoplanes sp. URMC 104]|uniref:tetratricopeptide repeat protein n=1 Tax=Actinoplanes sp. URMC 104 TaxID=3423409 RepID=UPI003F1DF775
MDRFATLPDPAQATSLDDLVGQLRRLKAWAGDPSYEVIKDRVNAAWTAAGRPAGELVCRSTVAYCFRPGRRRLDTDLVVAVAQALHPETGYVTQWRQTLRVVGGEIEAVSQVRVQDSLPQDLAGFTGRTGELDRLRHAARDGNAVVISAIEGMAGVGKTQLAVHAGHLLHREQPFERVLFVNLRGFDPDPAQPPADPAAVLDGFLRLLGMPAQQIPHTLEARAAAYRDRLTGTRALVVLDNAATTDQVRPLLPAVPGCLTLVTSRCSLAGLDPATHLCVDVFTPDEARQFLARAAPGTPAGDDPDAVRRIAERCGHLPLALGLVAGHVRAKPGWTFTDHADRLDERHGDRRLETGVELAFDLSYQHLPADRRRLLRLLALHPGPDFDAYAAAALADTDLAAGRAHLHHLAGDHLLQPAGPGRYTFHDLVRAYATVRATDEDRPPERRKALTRLFDYYVAVAATAMDTLHPAEAYRRPRIPPSAAPAPALTDPDTARAWLDGERLCLSGIAVHTAGHGWPAVSVRLSSTLYRYLDSGHHADALAIHGHAQHAARQIRDRAGQAQALLGAGGVHFQMGRYESATVHYQQAYALFRQSGDGIGEAHALNNLGVVEQRLGRYARAADHLEQALARSRSAGDRTGEARALNNLAVVERWLGRYAAAADHHTQALAISRHTGDRIGEASVLNNLGEAEERLGRYESAAEHQEQAVALFRRLGNPRGEAWALDSLGTVDARLGRNDRSAQHHRRALDLFRDIGDRAGQTWALNGLGEAACTAGDPRRALDHHTAARVIAADIGDRQQQARAHTGLGHAHRALGDPAPAREHYRDALALYTDLGMPEAGQIRAHLAATEAAGADRR